MATYPPNPGPLPSKDLCNKGVPNPITGDGPLEKGDSRKGLVEQLQKMLEFLEYSCGPQGADGIFGDNTRKAVLKFQSEHQEYEGKGLKQDGKVGPRTSDALNRCLVGKWFGKWLTPKEFITKDKDIREKFLLLTITQEELKKGEALDTKPEKEEEEIKKARVAVVDYAYEEVTLGIDLTLPDRDWLPDARNGRIKFTARIYALKEGVWTYPARKRRIAFELDRISRNPGVCMNYPPGKEALCSPGVIHKSPLANDNPDLFFADDDPAMSDFTFENDITDTSEDHRCPLAIVALEGDNPAHSHHYQKATTSDLVSEATVVVRCEDFGAYGFLKASAKDCETLLPREGSAPVSGKTGENTVKIPWDENGNDIADAAPQDKKNGVPVKADADDDADPAGDGTAGDGLTNFEEYRGFIVKAGNGRAHIRTDINKKDIFIHDRDGLATGYFGASGLEVHLIPDGRFYNGDSTDKPGPGWKNGDPTPSQGPDEGTQVINFNKVKYSKGDQHGLRLVDEAVTGFFGLGFGDWSKYSNTSTNQFIPKYVNRITVNKADVVNTGIAHKLDQIIAHELGHGVKMRHHGDGSCTNASHPANNAYDPRGGFASGNTTCIMRYDNYASGWCHDYSPGSGSTVHHSHAIPSPETPGTGFCVTKTAGGCNIAGTCQNDAREGECKKQIRVKDW